MGELKGVEAEKGRRGRGGAGPAMNTTWKDSGERNGERRDGEGRQGRE